jgi:hypothetical protein
MHWAQVGVSRRYLLQNTPQGLAKFHGFRGREGGGVQIHREERVVAYSSGTAVPLGDNSQRAEAQVFFFQEHMCRQQYPMDFLDNVDKLFTQEIRMFTS